MKIPSRPCRTSAVCASLLFGLLTTFASLPGRADAQWHSDSTTNTVVCNAGGTQDQAAACTDGANGVIVTWEDYRSGGSWDIWAQKLDVNGNPVWAANGVPVCRIASYDQRSPIICSDGSGGAYIVWEDYRTAANGIDLYAQHILSDGTRGYDTAGVKVCATVRDQNNATMCADGAGGAFVAWEDNRATSSTTRPDIYMNKLTAAGVQWSNTGLLEIAQSSQQKQPKLCDDGAGGCVLAWQTASTIPQSIWMARINPSGTIMWSTSGVMVYKGGTNTNISKNPDIQRDGSQIMIAWEETTSTGQEIRANRMKLDSTRIWYNPADVSWSYASDQTNPRVFSDDSIGTTPFNNAGLLVIFKNYFGTQGIECVRVLPNGIDLVPRAGTNFFDVCNGTGAGVGIPVGVKVGTGQLLTAWDDARNNDTNIYCQQVDAVPKRYFPSYGTSSTWGKPIRYSTTAQAHNVSLVSRTNGAIAVWEDNRNGNTDIYAQLIFKDGSLPVELTHFSATQQESHVVLDWETVSERDNAGFVIERRASGTPDFVAVQSYETNSELRGAQTSNEVRRYTAQDYPSVAGGYDYRIVDIGLNGSRTEHQPEHIELSMASSGFALMQNYPNPTKLHAEIGFTLATAALVDVIVYDLLGRVVAHPAAATMLGAGAHSVGFETASLATGTYLYRMTATDPNTGAMLWQSEKPISMQVVR